MIILHFPFPLPRTAWNAFHWSYCSENFGISVINVLFKMKYNAKLAHRLQLHHKAINWDKAQKQSCIIGHTKFFTKWRNCLSRYCVLMYMEDGGEEKWDTYKISFLPRTSKSYKNVSKFTPSSRTPSLTSPNMAIAKDSREVVHTQAIKTVQLMNCYSLTYQLYPLISSISQPMHFCSTNRK